MVTSRIWFTPEQKAEPWERWYGQLRRDSLVGSATLGDNNGCGDRSTTD